MTEKLITVGYVLGWLFTIYFSFGIAVGVFILWGYEGSTRQMLDNLKGKSIQVPFPKLFLYLILSISMIYVCS